MGHNCADGPHRCCVHKYLSLEAKCCQINQPERDLAEVSTSKSLLRSATERRPRRIWIAVRIHTRSLTRAAASLPACTLFTRTRRELFALRKMIPIKYSELGNSKLGNYCKHGDFKIA